MDQFQAAIEALSHKGQTITGLFASAVAIVGANVTSTVNIMDYIVFHIGAVYVTVQALITLVGATVGAGMLLLAILRFIFIELRKP